MPLKSEERTIDGRTVQVHQLPPSKAVPRGYKLARIIVPQVFGLAAQDEKADLSMAVVREAIDTLFLSLEPDEVMPLLMEVLEGTRIATDEGFVTIEDQKSFDRAFSGQLLSLFKVARFAIEVNYGDFSSALQSIIASLSAKRADDSKANPSS